MPVMVVLSRNIRGTSCFEFFFPFLCYISFPTCYKPKRDSYEVVVDNHSGDWRKKISIVISLGFHKLLPFLSAQKSLSVQVEEPQRLHNHVSMIYVFARIISLQSNPNI